VATQGVLLERLLLACCLFSCGGNEGGSDAGGDSAVAVDDSSLRPPDAPQCGPESSCLLTSLFALQEEAMRCDPDAAAQCQETVGHFSLVPGRKGNSAFGGCSVIVNDRDAQASRSYGAAAWHFLECRPCGCKLTCEGFYAPFPCPTQSVCAASGRCAQWWDMLDAGAD
jgi:hypothetical protein